MHTPFSDHSAIMLNIQSFDQRKKSGPGFWKFNESLLEDKEYVKKMCENIPAFIEKYKDVSDLGLKWDVIKMEIRSFTVQYSKRKAKLEKDKENQLLTKLNDLKEKLCSSRNDLNLLNEYHTLRAKLEKKLLNKKIKCTILRSKARWYENGEKNSSYFLNLEKRNFLRKKISKLKLSNGEETDDAKTILEEEPFIKNLYSTKNVNLSDSEFDIYFTNNLLTPLNEEQSKKCEGMVTEQECYQALKHMDNGKSPGFDGFTCEFYKFFRDYVQQNVVKKNIYIWLRKTPVINILKNRHHNTSTKKRQTDQSPLQPKAYLSSKDRLQSCHESNRKKTGSRSTACDKCWSNWLYQRTVRTSVKT